MNKIKKYSLMLWQTALFAKRMTLRKSQISRSLNKWKHFPSRSPFSSHLIFYVDKHPDRKADKVECLFLSTWKQNEEEREKDKQFFLLFLLNVKLCFHPGKDSTCMSSRHKQYIYSNLEKSISRRYWPWIEGNENHLI